MPYKDPAMQAEARRRWKADNPQKHYEHTHRVYKETAFAPKHKDEWTQAEDDAVMARDMTDRVLSEKIGRSVQAIQIRRCRLRKEQTGETDG